MLNLNVYGCSTFSGGVGCSLSNQVFTYRGACGCVISQGRSSVPIYSSVCRIDEDKEDKDSASRRVELTWRAADSLRLLPKRITAPVTRSLPLVDTRFAMTGGSVCFLRSRTS